MIYTNQHLRMNYIELLGLDYYFQGVYTEFERCQDDIIKLRNKYCSTVQQRNKFGFKLIYYKY